MARAGGRVKPSSSPPQALLKPSSSPPQILLESARVCTPHPRHPPSTRALAACTWHRSWTKLATLFGAGAGTVTAQSQHGHSAVTARSQHGHSTGRGQARTLSGMPLASRTWWPATLSGTCAASQQYARTVTARSQHGHSTGTARAHRLPRHTVARRWAELPQSKSSLEMTRLGERRKGTGSKNNRDR